MVLFYQMGLCLGRPGQSGLREEHGATEAAGFLLKDEATGGGEGKDAAGVSGALAGFMPGYRDVAKFFEAFEDWVNGAAWHVDDALRVGPALFDKPKAVHWAVGQGGEDLVIVRRDRDEIFGV
jgi:hypothetical protein